MGSRNESKVDCGDGGTALNMIKTVLLFFVVVFFVGLKYIYSTATLSSKTISLLFIGCLNFIFHFLNHS